MNKQPAKPANVAYLVLFILATLGFFLFFPLFLVAAPMALGMRVMGLAK